MNTDEHESPLPEEPGDLADEFAEETEADDSLPVALAADSVEDESPETNEDVFDDELEEEPEDEPFAQAYSAVSEPIDTFDNRLIGSEQFDLDLDVDAALAAVASLSDVVAEREASEDAALAADRPSLTPTLSFDAPKPVALRRGSLASVIPAAILIIAGALLTLATTSGAVIPTQFVVWGGIGAVGLLLISYWLSSRRWARGSFFFAALLLLSAAAFYAVTAPDGIGIKGYPLLIVAAGAAFVLTSLVSRPFIRSVLLPGILMILGGLAALGFTFDIFDASLLTVAAQYAWVVPVVLIVLWLLPLVFRRRE
ncbi:MAG: hypothetical protein IT320_13040 [Anaerolineae bacterium]|nr:hypothetical protein [Anaerolineae bacterium]